MKISYKMKILKRYHLQEYVNVVDLEVRLTEDVLRHPQRILGAITEKRYSRTAYLEGIHIHEQEKPVLSKHRPPNPSATVIFVEPDEMCLEFTCRCPGQKRRKHIEES